MNFALGLIALFLLATAAMAMALRNLIHSALLLVASWFAIAAFYLWAGAEFIAFAQVLVYAGAISMVVLFAVLLTRRSRDDLSPLGESASRVFWAGLAGASVVSVLAYAILRTPALSLVDHHPVAASVTMKDLGEQLMGPHIAAVLIAGVILTVALIGAVVIAAPARKTEREDAP